MFWFFVDIPISRSLHPSFIFYFCFFSQLSLTKCTKRKYLDFFVVWMHDLFTSSLSLSFWFWISFYLQDKKLIDVLFFAERNLNPKAACLKRREEEKADDGSTKGMGGQQGPPPHLGGGGGASGGGPPPMIPFGSMPPSVLLLFRIYRFL